MSENPYSYQRVDLERLDDDSLPDRKAAGPGAVSHGVRWIIIPISIVLCIGQALLTIAACNISIVCITPTLIAVTAFSTLFVIVLLINPLLRMLRVIRPFNRAELVSLFCALLVTSGISTFGLAEQLVPLVAAPWNPEWNTPQRKWDTDVLPNLNRNLYITDTKTILEFRKGLRSTRDGQPIKKPKQDADWGQKKDYYWKIFTNIQWKEWIRPLAFWMIFVAATYGFFCCLTYIVLRYWWKREKLIFPLARFSQALLPEEGHKSRWLPTIFSKSGFWFAFFLSLGILSWNALVAGKVVVGLNPILLGMGSKDVREILQNGPFEGLTDGTFRLMFLIIFTAIGIAFLLPLEVSFSVWFYFLVGKMIILVATWMGYGRTGADFPTDPSWINNPVTAQASGGMLLFSAVSLYRCLKDYYLLSVGRPFAQRLKLSLPVVGMVVCTVVMMLWLNWNRLGLGWALLFLAILTLLTLGLMRVVAEGGIYWFQSHMSFFHTYKMFGLGKFLTPVVVVPLLLIYWVLFVDLKTFMAPNLLNAARMEGECKTGRAKFHINLWLCIAISVVVALGFAIFLAHVRGAGQMHPWFYRSGPTSVVDAARLAMSDKSAFDATTVGWSGFGAVWVALSMFLRRSLFWFPHPIGYVMLISPPIAMLWFSFFLGWICKKIVVKYGGKKTFDAVRVIFLGLIFGELIATFVWPTISLMFDFQATGITLNRYSP
ncbi:MAG: hypothetical protein QF577_04885 [Phycisphaerae bacterium]|nr:hypothetical protein [Phycisphaerae bacterium]